ncbi:hypothetical protein H8356DRAFT_1347073 [Neocallimastix lanati (nom. inval.)]|nr:hypothetical protein H8356DRAFT_1347073 [Neocallimastix sp. JGI-2020a]
MNQFYAKNYYSNISYLKYYGYYVLNFFVWNLRISDIHHSLISDCLKLCGNNSSQSRILCFYLLKYQIIISIKSLYRSMKIYSYACLSLLLNNVAESLLVLSNRDDTANIESIDKQKVIQKVVGLFADASNFCICFFGYQFYSKIIFFIGFAAGVFIAKSLLSLIFVSLCVYKLSLCILSIPAGYGLLAIIIVFIPSIADKINTFLLTIILPIIFTILIFDKEIEVIIIVSSISELNFPTFQSNTNVHSMVIASLIIALNTQFISYNYHKDKY